MSVVVDRCGTAVVVRISGELDIFTAPELIDALDAVEQPYDLLILDMSALRFIDSTGIHLAVDEQRRAETEGFQFVLAGAEGPVLRTLRLTGLDVALPLAPHVESTLSDERTSAA